MILLLWVLAAGQAANTAWYASTSNPSTIAKAVNAVSLLACLTLAVMGTIDGAS